MLALEEPARESGFYRPGLRTSGRRNKDKNGNARQQRRTSRPERRAPDRRLSRRENPPGAVCQGQLLRAGRAPALFAPGLSGAGARRPGRARDAGSGADRRASDPTWNGWTGSTTKSIRAGRIASMPRSGATGPRLRTARSRRDTPASAPRSRGRKSRPPISRSRGRTSTDVPGLVNLFGIESPGLTASLALADDVVKRFRP